MSDSETFLCPKGCDKSFPIEQMHQHYNECTGAKPQTFDELVSTIPQAPTASIPLPLPPPPPTPYKEKEVVIKEEIINPAFCPKHGIEYIETPYYKICIKCKRPKIKPRMFWWFTLRYFLMASWLILLGGFILGIYSYHKIYG